MPAGESDAGLTLIPPPELVGVDVPVLTVLGALAADDGPKPGLEGDDTPEKNIFHSSAERCRFAP